MVVTVLIVTVSFGAAVTLPTFDRSKVETHKINSFVVYNSFAMYLSTCGSVLLMWAQFGGDRLAKRFYNYALSMVFAALVSMAQAFLAATDLVLTTPIAVMWFYGFIFYFFLSYLCTLSFQVFKSHEPVPVPAKLPMSIKILIWFYKNSPKEKSYKKLANSENSQQAAVNNQ